ncbi:MAG: formate dehydrogenase accessory sulfurtransferase FdhD [Saprospiraceae bacterium]|jgi:FdhD protein|nr:formate dehydrogenase accessory sulfurtransferase FdhD [Saprospiraceae bacterium]
MALSHRQHTLVRIRQNQIETTPDYLAVEEPLQLEVNGRPLSITMRTPGDDKALAIGFLFTEGMIEHMDQVDDVVQKDPNTVNVVSSSGHSLSTVGIERNFYATSSCGVCGKSSVDQIAATSKYIPPVGDFQVPPDVLYGLQDQLLTVQKTFELTGGLHASALFDHEGNYLYHSEDVGRHNALDKLIGHALMAGRVPLYDHILLLSGRASFELLQKASMAGIPLVAAVGAPSTLAVELAQANTMTLLGFLKKTGCNIYTHPHRICTA